MGDELGLEDVRLVGPPRIRRPVVHQEDRDRSRALWQPVRKLLGRDQPLDDVELEPARIRNV